MKGQIITLIILATLSVFIMSGLLMIQQKEIRHDCKFVTAYKYSDDIERNKAVDYCKNFFRMYNE